MMYGFPSLSLLATTWLPGALQLSFAAATVWGVTQGLLLRQPAVRDYLGISPLIPPTETTNTTPQRPRLNMSPTYEPPASQKADPSDEAKGFLGGARKEVRGMMKEAKEKMESMTGRSAAPTVTTAGKTKTFLQQAEAYEKRRKTEIEEGQAEKGTGKRRR